MQSLANGLLKCHFFFFLNYSLKGKVTPLQASRKSSQCPLLWAIFSRPFVHWLQGLTRHRAAHALLQWDMVNLPQALTVPAASPLEKHGEILTERTSAPGIKGLIRTAIHPEYPLWLLEGRIKIIRWFLPCLHSSQHFQLKLGYLSVCQGLGYWTVRKKVGWGKE